MGEFSTTWPETDEEPSYVLEEISPPPLVKFIRPDWAGPDFTRRNEESTT